MRTRLTITVPLALVFAAAAAAPAVSQAPPFGPDCRAVPPGAGAWVGTIRGSRQDVFDRIETRFQQHCFPSRVACERWLYAARTHYRLNFDNDGCRPLRR